MVGWGGGGVQVRGRARSQPITHIRRGRSIVHMFDNYRDRVIRVTSMACQGKGDNILRTSAVFDEKLDAETVAVDPVRYIAPPY